MTTLRHPQRADVMGVALVIAIALALPGSCVLHLVPVLGGGLPAGFWVAPALILWIGAWFTLTALSLLTLGAIWSWVRSRYPDVRLELTRHHLIWNAHRLRLEDIDELDPSPLRIRSGSLELTLDPILHAQPEMRLFVQTLRERVAALATAESREQDLARLAALASERR